MRINDILALPDLQAVITRFETKYAINPMTGCWEWQHAKAWNGYGLFTLPKHVSVRAHRFSYVIHKGPLPHGKAWGGSKQDLVIRHKCHNPCCVNPDHLIPGTVQQNTQDMIDAGRFYGAGEANRQAKLTNEQVRAIRLDTRHPLDIAAAYGISRPTVQGILSGRRWRSVKSSSITRPKYLSGAEGAANGRAKLTERDVLAIRRDQRKYPEIAANYGVHRETIGLIKRRKIWTHLAD